LEDETWNTKLQVYTIDSSLPIQIESKNQRTSRAIGCQLYTMRATIWIRGILSTSGIDFSSFTSIEGAIDRPGFHGKPRSAEAQKLLAQFMHDDGWLRGS